MREVAIVAAHMIPFRRYEDRDVSDLGKGAVVELLREYGWDKRKVQAAWAGTVRGGDLIGQRIFKELGMTGIPIVNVENACATGATAFREAYLAVATGQVDVALAVGVEQLSALGGGTIPLMQADLEVGYGVVMPAVYAMRAQRYLHQYGASVSDLASVAVKNARNGAKNPFAFRRKEVTLEEVLQSRPVADPLTLYQCCPNCDGGAAVLVVSGDIARATCQKPVWVRASVLTSGIFKNGYRDMTEVDITVRAAHQVYEQAGIGPEEIDVLECHDAFTIAELLYYEAFGLAPRGEGVKLLRDGATEIGGRVAVNPSGGLLAKGHPLGASGIAQMVEAFWQLRGEAGARQQPGARVAVTHVTGGGIWGVDNGACGVHVFST